ncbi:MAG: alginate export family protein [Acidobacteria bacterium]|nr:alginate export family protein [Acidobacteriota bacterium]
MRTRLPLRAVSAVMISLGLAGIAGARADEARKDVTWTLNGEARFRPEWRNNLDLNRAVDDDVRDQFMRLRLGFTVNIKDDYRVFVQAQDSREAGEESAVPATATTTSERNLDLHQGYLEIRKAGAPGLGLTIGRQEWAYGEHRMIGNYSWNNVGRSFDGAKIHYAKEGWFVDGLVARISNTTVGAATHGSDLYGVEYQAAPRKSGEYGGYWLEFADNVAAAGETGALGTSRVDAFGARMKDRFGPFDLNVEAAIERGSLKGDDLSASAAAAQGGVNWGSQHHLRVFGGYDLATGDRNNADGKREEFFNFFPTNHIHYGYADLEGWRNIRSPYAGASWSKGRHFAQAKVHAFSLENAAGPWKDAGGNVLGFDATGSSGTAVGSETDLTYRFALKEKATIEAGYSRFLPAHFAKSSRGDDPQDWGYVMLTVGF